MITTYSNLLDQVIVRLGVSTTSAFYTDAIIGGWIRSATRWATSYKKWPFTEARLSTTYVEGTEEWNFEGIKADSIRMLQVGGKRFQKLNFEDYQIYKEKAAGEEKNFSDFNRTLFINPLADASGTLTIWAQYAPVDIDITDASATTVFSNYDEEGNEAIVEKVLAYANLREKKENEANLHDAKAVQILDNLWKRITDEQFNYHTTSARDGMFERFDVLKGAMSDDLIKRDRFY